MEILENKLNTNPASMNDTTVKLNQLKADIDTINEHKLMGCYCDQKQYMLKAMEKTQNTLQTWKKEITKQIP